MTKTFQEAMAHRRSYYALKNESPITDNEIIDIVHSGSSTFRRLSTASQPVSWYCSTTSTSECGKSQRTYFGK